jgi:hypothetical protein
VHTTSTEGIHLVMKHIKLIAILLLTTLCAIAVIRQRSALAQLNDRTQNPNVADFGIAKSLIEQIGNGTGDWSTPGSSSFIIARDPFRAIRRGRQLFQRKFLRSQGQGPLANDGLGDINTTLSLGAGVSDSCAGWLKRSDRGASNRCRGRRSGSRRNHE